MLVLIMGFASIITAAGALASGAVQAAAQRQARADAAAGNLLQEGSVIRREQDLATRLEDEITNSTNAALQEANDTRLQGWYDRRSLLQQAGTARSNSRVSLLSGAVGALGALAPGARSEQ